MYSDWVRLEVTELYDRSNDRPNDRSNDWPDNLSNDRSLGDIERSLRDLERSLRDIKLFLSLALEYSEADKFSDSVSDSLNV